MGSDELLMQYGLFGACMVRGSLAGVGEGNKGGFHSLIKMRFPAINRIWHRALHREDQFMLVRCVFIASNEKMGARKSERERQLFLLPRSVEIQI
jgi:hypothetical protein